MSYREGCAESGFNQPNVGGKRGVFERGTFVEEMSLAVAAIVGALLVCLAATESEDLASSEYETVPTGAW